MILNLNKMVEQSSLNNQSSVNGLTFSCGNQLLMSGGDDGIIRGWDIQSGNELMTMSLRKGQRISKLSFSLDNQLLIACRGGRYNDVLQLE